MTKQVLTVIFLFISFLAVSQTFEIGPLLQYHRTAFQFEDKSKVVVSENNIDYANKVTESDQHLAFGGYAAYYTENTFSYTLDLFYVATSSPNYRDNIFQSINLIPNVGVEFLNTNLHISFGLGAGFILNKPAFENVKDVDPKNYKAIDGLAQLALHYRIKNILTIDGGSFLGLNNIVDEQRRIHFYLGARAPLNLIFK